MHHFCLFSLRSFPDCSFETSLALLVTIFCIEFHSSPTECHTGAIWQNSVEKTGPFSFSLQIFCFCFADHSLKLHYCLSIVKYLQNRPIGRWCRSYFQSYHCLKYHFPTYLTIPQNPTTTIIRYL